LDVGFQGSQVFVVPFLVPGSLLQSEDLANEVPMKVKDWIELDVQMKIQDDVARLNCGSRISQLLEIK
jgi:hypothetical protein